MTATDIRLEDHRAAIAGHCYRMLGSISEADDAVQETMVRAWKSLDKFEDRASVRTWLYRIATNVCIDELAHRSKRARPMGDGPVGTVNDVLETRERSHWIEPVPDAQVLPEDADPAHLTMLRESIRLAFIAALQHLPPRQRAALLLSEVVGWSATEVAESLEMTVPAVNSALQRARATLATHDVTTSKGPLTKDQETLVDRYVDAFERYDIDALSALLREDATLSMPPFSLWLQGRSSIRAWFAGRGSGCRGSRLVRTAACGSPAFGQYRADPAGGHKAWALIVLEIGGGGIGGLSSFLDTEVLFPRFGLPLRLDG